MRDFLGRELKTGDLVVFAATSGHTAELRIAVVLNAENSLVRSASYWPNSNRYYHTTKPGKIEREDKLLYLPDYQLVDVNETHREGIAQLRKYLSEYRGPVA